MKTRSQNRSGSEPDSVFSLSSFCRNFEASCLTLRSGRLFQESEPADPGNQVPPSKDQAEPAGLDDSFENAKPDFARNLCQRDGYVAQEDQVERQHHRSQK